MEILSQKSRQRCRGEDNLAVLYLSYDLVCFHEPTGACSAVNDTVTALANGFTRFAKISLRESESRQNGARHPIYASVTAIPHRADDRLICLELVFLAERFHRPIHKKHLILYWGNGGREVLNGRLLVGKRAKHLKVEGNLATDRQGNVYELKEKYRN